MAEQHTEKRPTGKREHVERQRVDEHQAPKTVERDDDDLEVGAESAYDGADPVGWDTRTHGERPSERPVGGDY